MECLGSRIPCYKCPLCSNENNSTFHQQLLRGLNEETYGKCLEFCLAHSKHCIWIVLLLSLSQCLANPVQIEVLPPIPSWHIWALRVKRVWTLRSDRSGCEFRLHLLQVCAFVKAILILSALIFYSMKWLL